jgi:HEAT repeat protein
MTRLGYFFTTLAAALLPAVSGSAFAQTIHAPAPAAAPAPAPRVFALPRPAPLPSLDALDALDRLDVLDQFEMDIDVQIPDIDVHVPDIDVHVPEIDMHMPDINVDVHVPPMDIQIPHIELPPMDMAGMAHMQRDLVEVGRLAQKTITGMSPEQVEEMKQRSRDAAEKAREITTHMRDVQRPKRAWDRCDRDSDRLYDCGKDALDDNQWDRAVDYFGKVAASKGTRADAALYWKAYAQNKLGQRPEALATIAEFKTGYAKSRWASDVSALEVDVRQKSGQPIKPGDTADDETKLLVLQSLLSNNSNVEVVPMLEKLLQGPQAPKVKERALFVLAQSQSPTARAIVIKVAKGGSNPDLQTRAVRFLGEINTPESRQALSEVYTSTSDPEVKRVVLRGYMQTNDREHLLAAARQETDQSLRLEAVRQLGNMRADTELADLYTRESSQDVKKQIIRAVANAGNAEKLMVIAQSEQDPELRRTAIRSLGQLRRTETGPRLTALYDKEQNVEVRKAVVDALFIQNNATALVAIARKERDPELKQELVRKLATMKDKEATDYLLELLK